jgi:hypothetical protein
LLKYVVPSFTIFKNKNHLNILDICFGLGYNTFATILYVLQNNIKTKIRFYSPELDDKLLCSLKSFNYPQQFNIIKNIIDVVSTKHYYKDEQFEINICIDDAQNYIKTLNNIDIVYQDPFSTKVNPELWTKQYFQDITKTLSTQAIINTYSIASPVKKAINENNLNVYEYKYDLKRKSTIASNFDIVGLMERVSLVF